jgi:hypothetical protein
LEQHVKISTEFYDWGEKAVELQGLYNIGVQAHGTSFWGQSEVAGDCASTEYLGRAWKRIRPTEISYRVAM